MRAVILTALGLEHEAVCAHLTDLAEVVHPEGTVYQKGKFVANGNTWGMFVVEIGAGNNRAAAEAEHERITLVEGVLFPTYAFGR
jgi:hypothetical protein